MTIRSRAWSTGDFAAWIGVGVLAGALAGCAGSGGASSSAPANKASDAGKVVERPVSPIETTAEWSYAGYPGRIVTTAHYKLYTTDSDAMITTRLPLFLETALGHYRTDLAPLPAPGSAIGPGGPLETFVLRTRNQWELLTKQFMGEQAEAYLMIPRGGYAAGGRAVLYDIGAAGTMSIAAHEGWHQYTQRTFRDGLPIWLEEGIATYMEGHRWDGAMPVFLAWSNVERFDQLRTAAAKKDLMSLADLLEATPQGLLGGGGSTKTTTDSALTYYAQVWALVHFLREGESGKYRHGLESLVEDAAAGKMARSVAAKVGAGAAQRAMLMRRGPAVFAAYFGQDLTTIGEEYAAFVGQVVRTGSRHDVVEGLSPIGK